MHYQQSARSVWTRAVMTGPFVCVLFALVCLSSPALSRQVEKRARPRPARQSPARLPADVRAMLDRIRPDSLRGHLSFIASDLLEGRDTPSRGLDLAAEYIAAQFRRAGLEPGGDPGPGGERSYFQEAGGPGSQSGSPSGSESGPQSRDDGNGSPERNSAGESKTGKLRNVIGLLRGSDPILKDSYLILSAHYDHVGIGRPVNGDAIYNGANDDGSGAVSVVEVASALATLKIRPKRSLLFITWFGEEKGLVGSTYYGKHPVFPLEKTVAMINLEQVGRTDSSEGPQLNNASLTGFDFSEVGPLLKAAGRRTGITVYKHPQNSDAFFDRSDNQSLANAGVPAHTLCVAFVYPDYHQPGDHWEKVDYPNLAKVDRMVALGLLMIANRAEPPKWNQADPKTSRYVEAWKALHRK